LARAELGGREGRRAEPRGTGLANMSLARGPAWKARVETMAAWGKMDPGGGAG